MNKNSLEEDWGHNNNLELSLEEDLEERHFSLFEEWKEELDDEEFPMSL